LYFAENCSVGAASLACASGLVGDSATLTLPNLCASTPQPQIAKATADSPTKIAGEANLEVQRMETLLGGGV
jgi:hypothetical protein